MRIYFAHSRSFNFQKELYEPIRNSLISEEHEIIFPHDRNEILFSSKPFFKNNCDLVVAEVSFPSTGMGIELGFANMLGVSIVCIYKKGNKISESLKDVANEFFEYVDNDDLIAKVSEAIQKHAKTN